MEIKTKPGTPDVGNLQKAADFVHAFVLGQYCATAASLFLARPAVACLSRLSAGFETVDAIALLRLDDLYVECFEIKDVKVRAQQHE